METVSNCRVILPGFNFKTKYCFIKSDKVSACTTAVFSPVFNTGFTEFCAITDEEKSTAIAHKDKNLFFITP